MWGYDITESAGGTRPEEIIVLSDVEFSGGLVQHERMLLLARGAMA